MKEYKRLTTKDKYKIIRVNQSRGDLLEDYQLLKNRLAELEDKIENGTLIEAKTCVWEEWEDDNLGSVWQCSNCKEDFCFTEGSVYENNYGYCPHCGAKIIELKELKGEV